MNEKKLINPYYKYYKNEKKPINYNPLELNLKVKLLAEKVLTKTELRKADKLSLMLTKTKKIRFEALDKLEAMVPNRPKRPLYYVKYQYLKGLPEHTRIIIKFLGDYIGELLAAKVYEITSEYKQYRKPLGGVIYVLRDKNVYDNEFIEILKLFNECYVDAKHNFKIGNKSHLFSAKDVVYYLFISMKIGKKLKKESKFVRADANDKFLTIKEMNVFLRKF